MHAVFHTATFSDPSKASAPPPPIIEMISALPGFKAGYWVRTSESEGTSMLVFDAEEGARAFVEFLRGATPADGTTLDIDSIKVGEVVGHA